MKRASELSGHQRRCSAESNHQRQGDTAETREAALPDGDPSRWVTGVVTPVGRDVGGAGAHEAGHDERKGESAIGRDVKGGLLETTTRVEVADVGSDCEAEAVDMKDERAEVKRSGNAGHG